MPSKYDWQNTPIDDTYIQNFAKDPFSIIGGGAQVGAQQQSAAYAQTGKINDYLSQNWNATQAKLKAIHPGIDLNNYLDKSFMAYDPGEGATANRNAPLQKLAMEAKARTDAIAAANAAAENYKATGTLAAAPDMLAGIKSKLAGLEAQYARTKDPFYLRQIEPLRAIASGAPISSDVQKAINASAARVGAPLAYEGAGIGDVAPGGAITNETLKSGVPYQQQVLNAQNGMAGAPPPKPPQDVALAMQNAKNKGFGGMAQSIIDKLNSGLSDAGTPLSYSQRMSLEHEFSQLTGLDSVPVDKGAPLRSSFPAGPDGDKQFQLAVSQVATKLKAQNSQLPTSILDAQNSQDATEILNKLGQDAFGDGTDGVPTRDSSTNGAASDASSYFNDILAGSNGSQSTITSNNNQSSPGGPPNFSAESKLLQLKQQYGVDPLESQIADIDNEIKAVQDVFTQNKFNEKGKAVNLGVMQGRISEEEQQANDRLNQLNRNKGYLVDQLNNKYNVIKTTMDAAQTDYTNATHEYETKFNQKIQATNALLGIDQAKKTDAERARDDARANVTLVTSALSNGSLTWDNLDPATKSQYAKLEMQAGLPTGTIQAFSTKGANAQWEMSTVLPGVDANGNAIATVLQKNKQTGEFKTTKLITDYAPSSKSAKSDVVQQGTFTDNNGNEVAWSKTSDGKVDKTIIGKAKVSVADMSPDQKQQNEFNSFVADVITKMQALNSFDEPKLTRDGAVKIIKAKYPGITQQSIDTILGPA